MPWQVRTDVHRMLALIVQAGDAPAGSGFAAQVLGECLPLVRPLSAQYVDYYVRFYGEPLRDDLQQAADLGTFLAARDFDTDKARSETARAANDWIYYLRWKIFTEMQQVVAESVDTSVPTTRAHVVHGLTRHLREAELEPGQLPSADQLGEFLAGMSDSDIVQALDDVSRLRLAPLEGALLHRGRAAATRPVTGDFASAVVDRAAAAQLLRTLGRGADVLAADPTSAMGMVVAAKVHGKRLTDIAHPGVTTKGGVSRAIAGELGRMRVRARGLVRREELAARSVRPPIADGSHPPQRR